MRMGTSPPTVSAHLQRLLRAGLLERVRVGRRVFYRASSLGGRILRELAAEQDPPFSP